MNLLDSIPIYTNMRVFPVKEILHTEPVFVYTETYFQTYAHLRCDVSLVKLSFGENNEFEIYGVETENTYKRIERREYNFRDGFEQEARFLEKAVMQFCEKYGYIPGLKINSWPMCKVSISSKNINKYGIL